MSWGILAGLPFREALHEWPQAGKPALRRACAAESLPQLSDTDIHTGKTFVLFAVIMGPSRNPSAVSRTHSAIVG